MFLLSRAFKKFAIIKPLTSRPANSERYIMCMGLLQKRPPLADYLLHVNLDMDDDKASINQRGGKQVAHSSPTHTLASPSVCNSIMKMHARWSHDPPPI